MTSEGICPPAVSEAQRGGDTARFAALKLSVNVSTVQFRSPRLSRRIDELASHLKKNNKDNHSRRGLLQMVADRRTHLNYLKRKSKDRYDTIVKKIGLK